MTVSKYEPHVPEDDLALFALGMLPGEETAAVAAHLRTCDVCRGIVGRFQGDMAALALASPAGAPSSTTRDRLLTGIRREPKFVPRTEADGSAGQAAGSFSDAGISSKTTTAALTQAPKKVNRLLPWLGWAVAAGLAATVGWRLHGESYMQQQIATESLALDQLHRSDAEVARAREALRTLTDPQTLQVTLQVPATPGAAAKPQGHAAYDASRGALVFVATNLKPVAAGRTYELWLLPAVGKPVPAGLFRPDAKGNASVVLPVLPQNVAAKGFGVTEEEDGGSLSPTPPILLAGT